MGNLRSTPMQPCTTKFNIRITGSHQDNIKEEPTDVNGFNAPLNSGKRIYHNEIIELSSSDSEDENSPSCDDSHKQLVVYEPPVPFEPFAEPISSFQRVLPSIGTYTCQCAICFKWRLIPTQEKYEQIRERITERPFVCEMAQEWRLGVSCDDPPDIEQDGSRLWAIDKPNIAQPPPGWQRDLRIRGEGGTRFADIYYTSPTGSTLRSIPDVEKYLFKHPEYVVQGVTLSQFSFQIPKPLQENYVRKRVYHALPDRNSTGLPGSSEPSPAEPLSLPGPEDWNPSPKKARSSSSKPRHNFDLMCKHLEM